MSKKLFFKLFGSALFGLAFYLIVTECPKLLLFAVAFGVCFAILIGEE